MRGQRVVSKVIFATALTLAARQSHAAIIYQDIPDVTLLLPITDGSVSAGIDFLDDGSNEFTLTLSRSSTLTTTTITITLAGTFPMAQVFVDSGGFASLYSAGQQISAGPRTQSAILASFPVPGQPSGNWRPVPLTGFAGISIDGFAGPNYGWARITTTVGGTVPQQLVTLHDFAFEGQPFTPILAGAIPAPGSIAPALASLLFGVGRRRR